jgi:hypothetical protein
MKSIPKETYPFFCIIIGMMLFGFGVGVGYFLIK